jgi:crossover junction endodeoxyribonuclease RuvC
MHVLGIDPGASGALALVETDREQLIAIHDMPMAKIKIGSTTMSQCDIPLLLDILGHLTLLRHVHVYVEQVGATPGKGAVQMFRFGENFGVLKGVLAGLELATSFVYPAEWKRITRCPRDKDGARQRAGQVFPKWATQFGRVKDDGRAEASLIALYGARHLRSGGIGRIA